MAGDGLNYDQMAGKEPQGTPRGGVARHKFVQGLMLPRWKSQHHLVKHRSYLPTQAFTPGCDSSLSTHCPLRSQSHVTRNDCFTCKSGAIAPLPAAWTAAGGGSKFSLTTQADNKMQALSSHPPQDQLAVARGISHQPGTLFLVPKYGQQNDGPKYAQVLIPGTCAYVILYRKGDSADVIRLEPWKGEIIILKYTGGTPILISPLKFFFFFNFWLLQVAPRVLVLQPGIKPMSLHCRVQSLNHCCSLRVSMHA